MKSHIPSKTTLPLDVKQTLKQAVQILEKQKIPSAWLDAEVLLSFVLKKDRAYVLSHSEQNLNYPQLTKFNRLVTLRAQHYPVAYLLGKKDFYDLEFIITKDTLVPRPESELLVQEAINAYNPKNNTLIIDIGTGSGCLLLSTVNELRKKNYKVNSIGLDISKNALAIAKKNSKKIDSKNISFFHSDLLSSLLKKLYLFKKITRLIILANLPYLTPQEIAKERSISQEPRLALYGGHDGLDLYKKLAKQINLLQKSYKNGIIIICEINPWQRKNFQKIWNQSVNFKKDLTGKIRIGVVNIK